MITTPVTSKAEDLPENLKFSIKICEEDITINPKKTDIKTVNNQDLIAIFFNQLMTQSLINS